MGRLPFPLLPPLAHELDSFNRIQLAVEHPVVCFAKPRKIIWIIITWLMVQVSHIKSRNELEAADHAALERVLPLSNSLSFVLLPSCEERRRVRSAHAAGAIEWFWGLRFSKASTCTDIVATPYGLR
jgi:hypothetical protein